MSTIALAVVALASLGGANAQWCYDRYNRRYRCNGGLSYGARIGIGVGIAAGILLLFLLCGYWKRRALRKRFQHFKPPPLPYNHNGNQPGPDQGYNPYVNNPPPPQSNFHQANSYNGGVQSPPATYQPSMAGQYGHQQSYRGGNDSGNNDHEHGYEWEQAREQERLDRQNAQGTAPPAYDPTNMPVGGKSYAPPSGPPPGK